MSFVFDRWFKFLLGALVFLFFLISVQDVYAPPLLPGNPNYSFSAHGRAATGVNRSSTATIGYAKGHCAHCHEQHASINGAQPEPKDATPVPSKFCLLADNFSGATANPYIQSNNACFYCHYGTGTYQDPPFSNYSYSITFGGNTDTTPATIFDAFDSVSYHNLNDVLGFATANWSSTFTADSNPCSACHNVHIAQRSCGKPTGSYDPTKSAISKPSDHNNLWGDDDGTSNPSERMNVYTSYYQAPYWNGSTTYFEPFSTNTTTNGSNLPDYVSFCQDCHVSSMTAAPYSLPNTPIDWATTGGETGGDKHGKNIATATSGANINLKDPYLAAWTTSGLVLACTDCHEPHGAPNVMLIRKEVNGGILGTIDALSTTNWRYLCARCHVCDTIGDNSDLESIHHVNADAPYGQSSCGGCHGSGGSSPPAIPCYNCHFHGGDDSWLSTVGKTPTGRRTF